MVNMRSYWLNQFWHTHSTPSLWIADICHLVCDSRLSVFSNLLEIDQLLALHVRGTCGLTMDVYHSHDPADQTPFLIISAEAEGTGGPARL